MTVITHTQPVDLPARASEPTRELVR